MNPAEFAEATKTIVEMAMGRITGIGAQQYHSVGEQKFEWMTPSEVLEYLIEEHLDAINYNVMEVIRLEQRRALLARSPGLDWRTLTPLCPRNGVHGHMRMHGLVSSKPAYRCTECGAEIHD
jgi:hypothetical protein